MTVLCTETPAPKSFLAVEASEHVWLFAPSTGSTATAAPTLWWWKKDGLRAAK